MLVLLVPGQRWPPAVGPLTGLLADAWCPLGPGGPSAAYFSFSCVMRLPLQEPGAAGCFCDSSAREDVCQRATLISSPVSSRYSAALQLAMREGPREAAARSRGGAIVLLDSTHNPVPAHLGAQPQAKRSRCAPLRLQPRYIALSRSLSSD